MVTFSVFWGSVFNKSVLQKYISGCISKLFVYWWGFQWVILKPSMVQVHPWLWILHSTAIWWFEAVSCHITGWPEHTELGASQLGIWVAWPEEEKSVKETNLCFKPLLYIEPSLTWQASVHARTDASWEKRVASNPGNPLSLFTHVQYSLIEKKEPVVCDCNTRDMLLVCEPADVNEIVWMSICPFYTSIKPASVHSAGLLSWILFLQPPVPRASQLLSQKHAIRFNKGSWEISDA